MKLFQKKRVKKMGKRGKKEETFFINVSTLALMDCAAFT